MMKPVFKKREIIVKEPNTGVALGGESKEETAIILYVGNKVENYKIGDTILFDKARVTSKIKYFGDTLWRIEHEDYITCQVVNE